MFRSLTILITCCLPLWAEEPPTPADLQRWAEQLDAERFEIREYAQQQLIRAGAPAIDVLAKKLAAHEVEGSRLGLSVLRELALQRDIASSKDAERVIRELASNKVTGTSFRAASVLRSLNEMRSSRALKILRQLGAKIKLTHDSFEEKSLVQALGGAVVFVTLGESWQGDQQDLVFLDWLNDYRGCKLTFEGGRYTDEFLEAIKDNQKVVGIHLKRTGMTDAGIAHTKEMKQLRNVVFQHCQLTSASLQHLDREPSLNLFYVFGAAMPKPAFDAFAKKHVDCITRYGRGGFLGIGGVPYVSTDGSIRGCEVQMVSEEHAAEKAGIQVDDIIIKYNGHVVTTFMPIPSPFRRPNDPAPEDSKPSLAELIGQNAPGDRVTVTVLRKLRELEFEVVLGDWP